MVLGCKGSGNTSERATVLRCTFIALCSWKAIPVSTCCVLNAMTVFEHEKHNFIGRV